MFWTRQCRTMPPSTLTLGFVRSSTQRQFLSSCLAVSHPARRARNRHILTPAPPVHRDSSCSTYARACVHTPANPQPMTHAPRISQATHVPRKSHRMPYNTPRCCFAVSAGIRSCSISSPSELLQDGQVIALCAVIPLAILEELVFHNLSLVSGVYPLYLGLWSHRCPGSDQPPNHPHQL